MKQEIEADSRRPNLFHPLPAECPLLNHVTSLGTSLVGCFRERILTYGVCIKALRRPVCPQALIPYLTFTMVSRFSILTNLLLISAALAAQPSRLDARLRENRQSKSSNHVGLRSTDYFPANTINWAGAIWSDPYVRIIRIHNHP